MNIIVTGGTRGIGMQAALAFAEDESNRVLIIGRDKDAIELVKEASSHNNIEGVEYDLSKLQSSGKELILLIGDYFGAIDILVNNAGFLVNRRFDAITEEETRKTMETNFFAPLFLIRLLLPMFNSGSHIVNIGSMGGFQGSSKYPGLSVYSASKAALACLSESLAGELKDYGISVNCLAPGAVQTDMLAEAFPGFKAPVTARDMGRFISNFAINGHKLINGKVIPVAGSNPD